MRYFFDTETNGFQKGEYGGALLSAALVREDGESIYLINTPENIEAIRGHGTVPLIYGIDPWVEENVIPLLYSVPDHIKPHVVPVKDWGIYLGSMIHNDPDERPQVIADWPSDIMEFCNLLMTGAGFAVPMLHQTHFTILRHIDVYPTSLPGAIQHNAWWDAMALRQWLIDNESR
jgi:hypothetical protein